MTPGFDHAPLAQVGQMFRDGHLTELEEVLKMTDAQWPLSEQVNDAQARLVAQAVVDLDQGRSLHSYFWNIPTGEYATREFKMAAAPPKETAQIQPIG